MWSSGRSTSTFPSREQAITYSPKLAGSRHVIRAWLALPEEIAARRNLTLTAMTSMATPVLSPRQRQRKTRQEAVFAARNAIDGIFKNSARRAIYQSWGINATNAA